MLAYTMLAQDKVVQITNYLQQSLIFLMFLSDMDAQQIISNLVYLLS